jgi:hypothetical protein
MTNTETEKISDMKHTLTRAFGSIAALLALAALCPPAFGNGAPRTPTNVADLIPAGGAAYGSTTLTITNTWATAGSDLSVDLTGNKIAVEPPNVSTENGFNPASLPAGSVLLYPGGDGVGPPMDVSNDFQLGTSNSGDTVLTSSPGFSLPPGATLAFPNVLSTSPIGWDEGTLTVDGTPDTGFGPGNFNIAAAPEAPSSFALLGGAFAALARCARTRLRVRRTKA